MDTFGLPHEISLLDYLEVNDGIVVLNHGINQYDFAAAFLGQWLHKVWPHNSNPLIICLGVYTQEETLILENACSKYPIIDSCGGVIWLGQETTGKDRRRALSRGGVFTASQQTWVIDLLQYRVIGSLVSGLLVLNSQTLPQRTSSRFIGQLLIASCGSPRLPYFVKALCPDPISLCTSIVALEKIVSILGLIMVASESNIILCPKSAAKITKYVDPLVKKYIKNEQVMVKMTTKIRIIQDSLNTLRVRAINQVVSNQDQSVIEELSDSLLSDSAATFLRNILFSRYIAEKSKDGEYSWHTAPEANLMINAALDRVSSFGESKSTLIDMHPRLVPVYQALEKIEESAIEAQSSKKVLVCLSTADQILKLRAFLLHNPEKPIAREVFDLSIAAQSHDYFPPFVRETLAKTLKMIGSDINSLENPQFEEDEELNYSKRRIPMEWKTLSIVIVAKSDISSEILHLRPSHVILSEFSSLWLRQLQYATARMHACVDWAFDEDLSSIPAIKTEQGEQNPAQPSTLYRGRRLINARVPVDDRSGDPVTHSKSGQPNDGGKKLVVKTEQEEISKNLAEATNSEELRSALRDNFSARMSAHQWVCRGGQLHCIMIGSNVDAEKFKASLQAEKSAWESLALQRGGLFVIQQKSRAEVYDTLPTEVDKIAYLLTLVAGDGGENVIPVSTRKGGGGVAALISALKANVIVPDLAADEYVASGPAQRRRVETAAVHEILKKSGKEIVEAMKTVVLVDIREMRSAVPAALWLSGIRILPLTLETADYILTRKVGVERKSISDLTKSLANGRLLSQVQRLTAQFEIPALLIELPGHKFLQTDINYASASPKALGTTPKQPEAKPTGDAMLIPRLCCLTLGFPKLRMLWTSGESFTPELFKVIKRFQPDPTVGDGVNRQRLTEDGQKSTKIYRCAANSQNVPAADALVYIPQFGASTCDLAVSNFQTLKCLISAEEKELEESFGRSVALECFDFFRRSFR